MMLRLLMIMNVVIGSVLVCSMVVEHLSMRIAHNTMGTRGTLE